MENTLTFEELDLETAEYLPPRLVMSTAGGCNTYNPCDLIDVNLCVSVRVGCLLAVNASATA